MRLTIDGRQCFDIRRSTDWIYNTMVAITSIELCDSVVLLYGGIAPSSSKFCRVFCRV